MQNPDTALDAAARVARTTYWSTIDELDRATAEPSEASLVGWRAVVSSIRDLDRSAIVPTAIETARDHLVQSEEFVSSAASVTDEVVSTLAVAEAVQAVAHALLGVLAPNRDRYSDLDPVSQGAHRAIDAVLETIGGRR